MRTTHEKQIIDAHVSWIKQGTWAIFVNLNFESGVSKSDAIQAARKWCNREDVLVYKHKVLRKGKRIKRAMYLEGDEIANYHYHGVWELPANIDSVEEYCAKLLAHWNETFGSGLYSKIEPIIDCDKVVAYICKKVADPNLGLCLETTHFS